MTKEEFIKLYNKKLTIFKILIKVKKNSLNALTYSQNRKRNIDIFRKYFMS